MKFIATIKKLYHRITLYLRVTGTLRVISLSIRAIEAARKECEQLDKEENLPRSEELLQAKECLNMVADTFCLYYKCGTISEMVRKVDEHFADMEEGQRELLRELLREQ